MSYIQDLLYGEQVGGSSADPIAKDVRRSQFSALKTQEKGLLGHNATLNKLDPRKQAASEIQKRQIQAKGGAADQQRNLQSNIARKGLGKSSIGQTASKDINQRLQDRQREIRSEQPALERKLAFDRASKRLNVGSQILGSSNAPIQFNDIQGQRAGGVAGLIGGAVGGYFGGGQGAKAGYNIGKGTEGAFG